MLIASVRSPVQMNSEHFTCECVHNLDILIYNPSMLICISYVCSVVPLFGSLKTVKPHEQLFQIQQTVS